MTTPALFKTLHACLLPLFAACVSFTSLTPVSAHTTSEAMAEAAQAFLAALNDQQRATATFEMKDTERKNWHFIPKERNGLVLKKMSTEQRQLAYALLSSALSHSGLQKSLQIMTLEQILHEMENNAPHRDPELYYVSIFGEPSTNGPWAWRVEGHHLSVNFTVVGGQVVAPTPSFFGTNPAHVLQGARKGLRVLAAEEDLGRQLATSFSEQQKKTGIIATEAPADVFLVPDSQATPLEPKGVLASDMSAEQVQILRKLVQEYVHRLRPELAQAEMTRIKQAGFKNISFAWAGGLEKGQGHYYRVQGPTFIFEYDNTQNNANHVHTVWRDVKNDFGENLLKKHYESAPH